MPKFFYYDANGQKQGPVNEPQLQSLATQGIVTPETALETESGYRGVASQIPGLNFNNRPRVTPVQNTPHSQTKFSMDKWLLTWLRDFAFRDIRLPIVNLWVCRIIYAVYCIILALAIVLGTPFLLFVAFTSKASHDAPIAFSMLFTIWICGPIFLVALRLALEWYIIMFDWIVETTKAARIYSENNQTE